MTQENNLISFDEAYKWLNQFDHRSYLSEPVTHLVMCMKSALQKIPVLGYQKTNGTTDDAHSHDDAHSYIKTNKAINDAHRYIKLSKQVVEARSDAIDSRSNERAEVFLECGWTYFYLGEYAHATSEFRRAKSLYISSHIHNAAVTYWLLGYTLWRQSKQSDAIIQWEQSCRIYEKMRETSLNTKWYEEQSKRMVTTLRYFIDSLSIYESVLETDE